ncbi:hypothetical protein TR2A62_0096 [Thalassobium sp. R2A62]|nr:hypothetical protein TR2A62_0096 [Thalassobium sp. R2A62]
MESTELELFAVLIILLFLLVWLPRRIGAGLAQSKTGRHILFLLGALTVVSFAVLLAIGSQL